MSAICGLRDGWPLEFLSQATSWILIKPAAKPLKLVRNLMLCSSLRFSSLIELDCTSLLESRGQISVRVIV